MLGDRGWDCSGLGDRGWGLLGCSGTEVGTKENVWMRLGFRGYLDDARCSMLGGVLGGDRGLIFVILDGFEIEDSA